MELILYVEKDKSDKLSRILYQDDVVSRANIIFREASILGRDGYYVRILGSEEQVERAIELSKELAKKVEGEEKEKVREHLKSEDDKMLSGFSGVFG